MSPAEKIKKEIEKARTRKRELTERLRSLEVAEQKNFHEIWTTRDQIAYWEGRAEGLQFSLDAFDKQ